MEVVEPVSVGATTEPAIGLPVWVHVPVGVSEAELTERVQELVLERQERLVRGLVVAIDDDMRPLRPGDQLSWVSGVGSSGCGAVAGQARNGADDLW